MIVMEQRSFEWLEQRDLALTIPCRGCKAPIGQPCRVRGRDGEWHELEHFPAHHARLNRAERLQRMQDAPKPDVTCIVDGYGVMRSTMVDPI
ncbi:hypothetical protein CH274_15505 [Rhodococcus sp. 06-418-5]|nr:hypothetical protein [Rhodococcus sp. 06-418-5]OZC80575.1 hypothetical protein CH274_15505 [Rhodococcus sp. 06-418-5]